MKLVTVTHDPQRGWSQPLDSQLDSPHTLVLVFGSPDATQVAAPLAELARALPQAHVLGCSTAGEIHGDKIQDDGLVAAIARFERTELAVARTHVAQAADSFAAGERLARELVREGLRGVFVLSDGLNVNGSELVRGLSSVLPPSVVISGGLAGDGSRFERTWVVENGAPAPGVVSCVGFTGDAVHIGHGSKGGWDKFGPERRVTRAAGNVLYELDGKPALELYKTYLGDRAAGLPATGLLFPLAIRAAAGDEKVLVRTILAVDEATQSMTFAGDVPEGSLAQLMRANFERLIAGAGSAALATGALQAPGAREADHLAIAISCVGRRLVLGERTEEELEATLEGLPLTAHQVGFYSYGEISTYASGICDLQNQTMTLTSIREDLPRAA